MMKTKGKKVHKAIRKAYRRRESPCGLYWYTDWPTSWQYASSFIWRNVTCGNCLKHRP